MTNNLLNTGASPSKPGSVYVGGYQKDTRFDSLIGVFEHSKHENVMPWTDAQIKTITSLTNAADIPLRDPSRVGCQKPDHCIYGLMLVQWKCGAYRAGYLLGFEICVCYFI